MNRDPYRIAGPAIISFSGGRSSGYMLWRVLGAYGGIDAVRAKLRSGQEEHDFSLSHARLTRFHPAPHGRPP